MPDYFGQFIMTEECPGILIVSQRMPVAQVAEELFLIWYASEPDEWVNRIRSLPL
jgi:hypothetical protein